jgi:hypothetical protein
MGDFMERCVVARVIALHHAMVLLVCLYDHRHAVRLYVSLGVVCFLLRERERELHQCQPPRADAMLQLETACVSAYMWTQAGGGV